MWVSLIQSVEDLKSKDWCFWWRNSYSIMQHTCLLYLNKVEYNTETLTEFPASRSGLQISNSALQSNSYLNFQSFRLCYRFSLYNHKSQFLSFFKKNVLTVQHIESWIPNQGSNPCPLHWKCSLPMHWATRKVHRVYFLPSKDFYFFSSENIYFVSL